MLTILTAGFFLGAGGCDRETADAISGQGSGMETARLTIERLVDMTASTDGRLRVAAAAELFRRDPEILADLERLGARPLHGIRPTRLEAIYSLLRGLEPGDYAMDSFGLHLDGGVSTDDLTRLSESCGIDIPGGCLGGRGAASSCYVTLREGQELEATLRRLLVKEPVVVTVSLNYYER